MGNPAKNFLALRKLELAGLSAVNPRSLQNDPVVPQVTAGLTPFIRENDINFAVSGLKPDNAANIFFDEIKVNNFCQRASYINVTSSAALANIRINEGLFGTTSNAYAEILGTSINANDNQIYINDNFISVKIQKGAGAASLSVIDFQKDDLVYQTTNSSIYDFSEYSNSVTPAYTFFGRVKKWRLIDSTTGVLVIEPLSGTLATDVTDSTKSSIWNLSRYYVDEKNATDVIANNRFSSGESIQFAVNSASVFTVSSTNSYVALSSTVSGSNTSNLRSIVLSTSNVSRDGIATINGNTISIVSGTNMGFSANVIGVVANSSMGWLEAIVDADMPEATTSNTVYSIGSHKINDVGAMYGIFHIPSETNLKWLTGERTFIVTDTASYNDNDYNMRAITRYTALGKVNTDVNARNTVLREMTPSTQKAPEKTTQQTQKLNDRKFMAQTFFTPRGTQIVDNEVKNGYGIFLSSVDLFFKAKPTNAEELLPFTVALCKVESGIPSYAEPLASRTLEPAYIKISDNPSTSNSNTATTFRFTDPVYLLPETEYAIKLVTESSEYEVWTAKLGDEYIDNLGNTRRISDQPNVGNFFKSQNASLWNPIANEDLMFVINRASFETGASGNTVYFNLTPNDKMSANLVYDYIQLTATEQVFAPTTISYEVKTVLTDGTVTDFTKVNNREISSFGGDTEISSTSKKRRRLISSGNVASINVKVTMRTTDDSVAPILNRERFGLTTLQNIVNNAGIANNLVSITNGGAHSNASNIVVTISAPDVGTNTATANVLSSQLVNGKIVGINIINPGAGYFTSPTIILAEPSATTNASAIVNGENDVSGGNILAKYQTKIVTLEDGFDSGDLIVRLNAIRPSGTNIAVYFKVLSALDSDPFNAKKWQKMQVERDNFSSNATQRVPLVFKHSLDKGTISYTEGTNTYPLGGTFKYFAVKICLTAEDPSVIPYVEAMRAMAVPGG